MEQSQIASFGLGSSMRDDQGPHLEILHPRWPRSRRHKLLAQVPLGGRTPIACASRIQKSLDLNYQSISGIQLNSAGVHYLEAECAYLKNECYSAACQL